MSMTGLFLDTNVLLHYRRVDEIDWLKVSGTNVVVLLICPVVIRELDQHKDGHPQTKLRKRAQEVIADLQSKLEGTSELRAGVQLEFLACDPQIDFATHGLHREVNDDWLIASVIEWQTHQSGRVGVIVSADLGVSIKARAHGISVIKLSDDLKLASEQDPEEAKLKRLQLELAELRNSLPELQLTFPDGKSVWHVSVSPPVPIDDQKITADLSKARQAHPQIVIPEKSPGKKLARARWALSRNSMENLEAFLPSDQVQRYNTELDTFFTKHEGYLRALHRFENQRLRTVGFEFLLTNTGGVPAEDIDVHLHFPDGFELFSEGKQPGPPVAPEPPLKPGHFRAPEGLQHLASMAFGPRIPGPPPNVSPPQVRRTGSYDVDLHVRQAKHGYSIHAGQFVVLFESYESASSFSIDYTIRAANHPKAAVGRLSVVVQKRG
jgi:hypothetical protein